MADFPVNIHFSGSGLPAQSVLVGTTGVQQTSLQAPGQTGQPRRLEGATVEDLVQEVTAGNRETRRTGRNLDFCRL